MEKHNSLKKKHCDLKEEMKDLCSTFETVLQEKEEITSERDFSIGIRARAIMYLRVRLYLKGVLPLDHEALLSGLFSFRSPHLVNYPVSYTHLTLPTIYSV